MRKTLPLILVLAAGCSGGPLKERPVLEPPPEPGRSGSDAEPPSIVGAWASTTALGPGSAALQRILLVFDAEGNFSGAAFGGAKPSTIAGTYRSMDGAIEVALDVDDRRLWAAELERDTLVLREGEGEIRLERVR